MDATLANIDIADPTAGADEDEITDHVNAGELLLPPSLSLIIDVQEDEETCKCNCEGQKGSLRGIWSGTSPPPIGTFK